MNQIFRISGAAALAGLSSLVLAPVSMPVLGQTTQSITCQPSTVTVSPSSGNLTVSCTSPGGGGTPPPPCSVSVFPATLPSAGGSVNVTASNCGTITSWTGAQSTGAQAAVTANPIPSTFTDTLQSNTGTSSVSYTYSVVGSGGTNTSTVFVSAASGGTGGATSCGSPTPITWGSPIYTFVTVSGSATASFTVPATAPIGSKGIVQLSTLSGGSFSVTYALTSAPCTFPTAVDPTLGGPATFTTSSGSIPFNFQVGGSSSNGGLVLQPGQTYFVNLKAKSKTLQIYVTSQ